MAATIASPTAGAAPAPAPGRLPWRTAMAAAVVVTLVRPATWVVALAGFLAGAGIVVLAWPIMVLPTPTGIQNLLGAPIANLVFGGLTPRLAAALVAAGVAAAALILAGLLAGAWAEVRGIGLVLHGAADEGYIAPPASRTEDPHRLVVFRVAVLRLLSLVPPLMVFALSWKTLYDVTYHELILPGDLTTPLPIRVMEQVPLVLAALFAAWLLADAAAAVGARRLVLERRRLLEAWALGWADLVRRPHRIVGAALFGDLALLLATGPALVAASLAWVRVREALEVAVGSPIGIIAAALWVAIWLGSVVLAGVGAAVRAAAWTLEWARRR